MGYKGLKINKKVGLKLIPITKTEKTKIQKENPRNNIKVTGRGKKSGNAFVIESDIVSVDMLARLRGYETTKKMLKELSRNI